MNTDQKYKLLSMMGYKGPKNESLMSSFVESNPAAGAKMGQFMSASKGFNQGGVVRGRELDSSVLAGTTNRGSGATSTQGYNPTNTSMPSMTQGGVPTNLTALSPKDYTPQQAMSSASGGQYTMGANNTIMKPDGTAHQTYGSLNEAYNALQALNNPSTGTNTGGTAPVAPPVVTPPPVGQPPVTNTGGTQAAPADGSQTGGVTRQQFDQMSPQQQQALVDRYPSMPFNSWMGTTGGTPTPTPQPTPTPDGTQTGFTPWTEGGIPVSSLTGTAQEIAQAYNNILGRNPGQAGLDFYIQEIQSGRMTLPQVQQQLQENKLTEDKVRSLFTAHLGREVDLPGLQYYVPKLNSGELTEEQVIQQLQDAARGIYGGAGTQDGGPPISGGGGQTGGATTTLTSQEAVEQFTTLRDAYREIFGRNPDQGGLDHYLQQLQDDRPMVEILNELLMSPEAQELSNEKYNELVNLRDSQQKLLSAAYQSPQDLVLGQDVERIEVREGELIDQNTGQLGTPADSLGYTPTTVAEGDVATATAAPRSEVETYEATTVSEGVNNVLAGLEAQTADPTDLATVQGQLTELMKDFDGGKRPPWASGVMRETMAVMQQRGLGASSMAGMAVVQSAMEAATNIAQQDAQTFATFELQNLNNRQQTAIFKTQQRMAGLFSDQAAENAQKQFNASSINQYNQFREQLETQVSQFNAAQINSMMAMNMDAENAAKQFNSSLTNQREQFNANNSLIVSQANAQWRQNINTINTAAQNDANREYVRTVNAITTASLDQLWQRERDLMTFAFSASESALDRELRLLLDERQEDLVRWQEDRAEDAAWGELLGSVVSRVFDW